MPRVRLSRWRLPLEALHVAAAALRPIGGVVAVEPSHLDLSVAHHYHELAEAGAHFVRVPGLEPSQVKPFSVSVVWQCGYSNSQDEPAVYKHRAEAPCCSGAFNTFPGRFPATSMGRATLTPAT